MYCGRELEEDEICNCHEKATARSKSVSSSSTSNEQASPVIDETTNNTNVDSTLEDGYSATSESSHTESQDSSTQASFGSFHNSAGPTYVYHPPIPKDSPVSLWFARIWQYLKHFFVAPADTIAKAAHEKDYPVAIFFFVIRAILTSSFVLAILRGAVVALNKMASPALGTRYFTLNSFLQSFGLNAVGAFFLLLFSILIGNLIFCVLSYAVAKIFKSKTSFAAVIGAVGVSSIGITAAFVVATIITLLIPSLAMPVFLGFVVLDFSFTYIALIKSFKLSGNKMTYLFALIAIVYATLFVLFYKISPLSSGFSNLTNVFSNLSSGSLSNSFF